MTAAREGLASMSTHSLQLQLPLQLRHNFIDSATYYIALLIARAHNRLRVPFLLFALRPVVCTSTKITTRTSEALFDQSTVHTPDLRLAGTPPITKYHARTSITRCQSFHSPVPSYPSRIPEPLIISPASGCSCSLSAFCIACLSLPRRHSPPASKASTMQATAQHPGSSHDRVLGSSRDAAHMSDDDTPRLDMDSGKPHLSFSLPPSIHPLRMRYTYHTHPIRIQHKHHTIR